MHIVSNIIVVLVLAGGVALFFGIRRSRMWSQATGELWRRRPIATIVLCLFATVALLDSISWVGTASSAKGDQVAASKPRSLIDRMFQPDKFKEASYSAPMSDRGFYDKKPLSHPGEHILGTDILGNDVLYRTLKGVRVALLIGGFTSLIVIPIALLFGVSAGYFGGRVDDE